MILSKEYNELIDYFDACRSKRNISDYDRPGCVSNKEADEILTEAKKFKKIVMKWLKVNAPGLVPFDNTK